MAEHKLKLADRPRCTALARIAEAVENRFGDGYKLVIEQDKMNAWALYSTFDFSCHSEPTAHRERLQFFVAGYASRRVKVK